MQEQEKPALGERIRSFADRFWADREIILRSDGHVRYLRISRVSQIALMFPAMAVAGGLAWAGWDYIHQREEIAHRQEELAETRLAYLDLMSEVAEYQNQFSDMTREMEDNQAYLLGVLEQNATLRKDLASFEDRMRGTDLDRSQIAIVREALRRRLDDFETELGDANSENHNLEAHLTVLRQRLEESETERTTAMGARDALEDKVASMRGEVRQLEESREQLEATIARLNESLKITEQNLASLQKERDQLSARLEETASSLSSSQASVEDLTGRLTTTTAELEETRKVRDELAMIRERLEQDLARDRKTLASANGRNLLVETRLERTDVALGIAISERANLEEERDTLSTRVQELDNRLVDVHESQRELLTRLADRTRDNLVIFEKTIGMTGLDVAQLVETATAGRTARGGPYVAAMEALDLPKEYEDAVVRLDTEMDRWETLQRLLQSLPLAAPVDQYRLTSGFGKRVDPLNRRPAVHYGLDFAASVKTTIYAPAPGKVTYAGWKGNYGRFVEIDHGFGLKTRYGHLHSIDVKKGQTVEFRDRIAKLGNSGRSTGPHLHYEVTLNGRPINPKKFLTAGRYVFKK